MSIKPLIRGLVSQDIEGFVALGWMGKIQDLLSAHAFLHFHNSGQVFYIGKGPSSFMLNVATLQFVSAWFCSHIFFPADLMLLCHGH